MRAYTATTTAVVPPRQSTLTSDPRPEAQDRTRVTNSFPVNSFKHFLTLFSKFFSSFPRGTFSLSVSRQYLALDGIYHPLQTAVPNSPTRRNRLVEQHHTPDGALTLSDGPFQST